MIIVIGLLGQVWADATEITEKQVVSAVMTKLRGFRMFFLPLMPHSAPSATRRRPVKVRVPRRLTRWRPAI
jgi:hypothetical protein